MCIRDSYWRGEIAEADLLDIAKRLRELNWQHQAKANADFVAVADFTLYDHILDLQVATGAIPARFGFDSQNLTPVSYTHLDVYKRQSLLCTASRRDKLGL